MKFIKETGTAMSKVAGFDVIELDLSSDGVIFDDIVDERGEPASDSESEMDPMMDTTADKQTGN